MVRGMEQGMDPIAIHASLADKCLREPLANRAQIAFRCSGIEGVFWPLIFTAAATTALSPLGWHRFFDGNLLA